MNGVRDDPDHFQPGRRHPPARRAHAGVRVTVALVLIPLAAMPAAMAQERPAVTYRLESIAGGLPGLRAQFTAAQLAVLEKLNRRDLEHLGRADVLLVPDRWDVDELAYSPMPAVYMAAAALPKLLVVHQPLQVFGAYQYGLLMRWGPVSTGRQERPTPSGHFHLNWRSRGRRSTVNRAWYLRWYFNFHNREGLSLHEYELPGSPASHACVRLLRRDARWLFAWGEEWTLDDSGRQVLQTGTPLFIVGRYAFDDPPPWLVPGRLNARVELPSLDTKDPGDPGGDQ